MKLKAVLSGLLLLAIFMLHLPTQAQWTAVGGAGFTPNWVEGPFFVLGPADTPHIAFRDGNNANKTTIMKYNGSSWVNVGSAGFSAATADWNTLSFDSNDTPYVAYQDAGNSSKVTAKKFDGSSWQTVGTVGFSPGAASNISIDFGANDTPFVAFSDLSNSGRLVVMKYDGTTWVSVGGFISTGSAAYTAMVMNNDTPYVVYSDNGISGKVALAKYNGTSWTYLGGTTFSTNAGSFCTLAFDSNNNPWVGFNDQSLSKGTVMKYSGGSWSTVGTAGFTPSSAGYMSLKLNANNVPYVAFWDGAVGKASAMRYDGSSWSLLGSQGFSAGSPPYIRIDVSADGTVYAGYKDGGNGDKATVMSYTFNTWNGTTWSGGAPGSSTEVVINSNTAPGTITCGDMTINSGFSLNTGTNDVVTIHGNLANGGNGASGTGTITFAKSGTASIAGNTFGHEGTITVSSGCTLATNGLLLLKSNATNTGRIGNSAGTISGNVTAERYQPGKRCFRFYAHPFTTSIALSQLTDDIDITGSGGATNGFTTTATNAPSAFWFDVTAADTSTTGANPGWTAFTHTNGAGANSWDRYELLRLLVRGDKGQGLAGGSYTPNASTFEAAGAVNQGTQVITLTKGTNTNFVGCGNPFPSGIQMQNVAVGSNVGANYYAWDATSGAAGAYVTNAWTLSYVLPAYSAFFTTLTATDNITIEEADKATGGAGLFKGTSSANWVELVISDSSTKWDRLLINLDDNAMDVEDKLDGKKLYNPGLDFFTLSKDSTRLAVDVRPYTDSNSIPLGLTAYTRYNRYVIRTGMFDIPAGTKLYLQDKYLNKQEELKTGFEYWFDVTADSLSQGNQRFEINMMGKPTNSIGLTEKLSAKMQLIPNPAREEVKVSFDKLEGIAYIRLMNVTGQTVYVQTVNVGTGSIIIPLRQVPSGIYIVELQSTNARFAEKLIKE